MIFHKVCILVLINVEDIPRALSSKIIVTTEANHYRDYDTCNLKIQYSARSHEPNQISSSKSSGLKRVEKMTFQLKPQVLKEILHKHKRSHSNMHHVIGDIDSKYDSRSPEATSPSKTKIDRGGEEFIAFADTNIMIAEKVHEYKEKIRKRHLKFNQAKLKPKKQLDTRKRSMESIKTHNPEPDERDEYKKMYNSVFSPKCAVTSLVENNGSFDKKDDISPNNYRTTPKSPLNIKIGYISGVSDRITPRSVVSGKDEKIKQFLSKEYSSKKMPVTPSRFRKHTLLNTQSL